MSIMSADLKKKLKFGIVINSIFTIFEIFVGIFSGSLALIADATHNLTDVMSLLVSYIAHKIALRPATEYKTFGYGRVTILAALFNALILLGLALLIFYKAYERFYEPEPIEGMIVIIVGFLGMIINAAVAYLFASERDDLHIHSAFLNMLFDAVASAGALLSGIIITFTGATIADPIISILIGSMLIISAFQVVNNGIDILLEGVPSHVPIKNIRELINHMPGVLNIHKLHIWSISSTHIALSCQVKVTVDTLDQAQKLISTIKYKLADAYDIHATTIELDLA